MASTPTASPDGGSPQWLVVVRHGETTLNRDGLRCGGDLDPDMTETGEQQVRDAARLLREAYSGFDLIVFSPLRRTRRSAELIAAELPPCPQVMREEVGERRLGAWNGQPIAETEPRLRAGETPPDGEPELAFQARVAQFVHWMQSQPARRVLLITSKGVVRMLGRLLRPDHGQEPPLDNGRFIEFQLPDAAMPPLDDCSWLQMPSLRRPDTLTWSDFQRLAKLADIRFNGAVRVRAFDYIFPERLQKHWPLRQRRDTPVRVSFAAWGDESRPLVLCVGGIANTARRFDYLAQALSQTHFVVAMDWVGRGLSGWMPRQGDYGMDTYVDQIEALLAHLGRKRMTLVGSSLGGMVGLVLAGRKPDCLERLILNDVGPYLPAKYRQRRAEAVSRHYVFRTPAALLQRLGAAAKNDGPMTDEAVLHNIFHQTKWSEEDGGRVYRHDPRALQAYADEAGSSVVLWDQWQRVRCPVLLLQGLVSDALTQPTLRRMMRHSNLSVIQVPRTGHTPALSDRNLVGLVADWLCSRGLDGECSCVHALET